MTNKNQSSEQNGSLKCTDKVVESKVSKYLRYFVWFVLIVNILLFLYQAYRSYSTDGVIFDNELINESFYFFFFTVMTLIYMSLSGFIQKKMKIVIPPHLISMIALFIFLGTFLGQAMGFFAYFFWWDKMLHTISGMILGLIAFAVISAFNDSDFDFRLGPIYAAIVSFLFAVAVSGLWEVAEYSFDCIFGTTMQCWNDDPTQYFTGLPEQGAGLIDTMEDLIVATIGAFIVSVVGYSYLKKGKSFMESKRLNILNNQNSQNSQNSKIEND
ncbi:MAG: hypothetical protein FWH46_05470 [Methanimicrococcus sp.]|nr:hypothetical protein [Methanimicrococcus sp.]